MIIVNKFQPYTSVEAIEWPTIYPFKITTFSPSGTTVTRNIREAEDIKRSIALASAIAVKITNVVDPRKVYAQKFVSENWDKGVLDTVLAIIERHDLVDPEVDDQPLSPLLPKKIVLKLNREHIRVATKWLTEVNGSYTPTCSRTAALIGNDLLAIRAVTGGMRVINAAGFSIPYTSAKRIYRTLKKRTTKPIRSVEAREPHNFSTTYNSKEIHYGSEHITIGCQEIPVSAIEHLAKREGW